jgi:hypothetical protein
LSLRPICEEIRAYISCGSLLLTTMLRGISFTLDCLIAELACDADQEMSSKDWLGLLKAGNAYRLHFSGEFRHARLLRVREDGKKLELTFQLAEEGKLQKDTKATTPQVQISGNRFCKRFDE